MKIPWQAKMAGKMVLSRMPFGGRVWRRVGVFRHGAMEDPAYACKVFETHYNRVCFPRKGRGFYSLELGPGDSLFSALIAHACGAAGTYLIDSGSYASEDVEPYRKMIAHLNRHRGSTLDMAAVDSREALLAKTNAVYGTNGLKSLAAIPDASVDFIWSQAVLEHVRLQAVSKTMGELRRIVRSDGICSHRVDLRDHLGGALNHLRWSRYVWESDFMASSGFYTNRIRYGEILNVFRDAGFRVDVLNIDRWDRLPTPRSRLSEEFRDLSDDELLISGFDVLLSPR